MKAQRRLAASPHQAFVAALTILSLAYGLAFPSLTLAAETANCAEFQENRWRGEELTGGQKHGASATATATLLFVCTNPFGISLDGSFYFSNVTPTTGAHFNDIVQVGFGMCRLAVCPSPPTQSYIFSWGRDPATPGCTGYTWSPPVVGTYGNWTSAAHTFGVNHVSNQYRGYVDGVVKAFVSEAEICWAPAKAVWFGETLDVGDQIGGTPASKLRLSNMTYQNAEGGGFFFTNFNAAQECNYSGGPPAPYFCDITGARSIDVWTDR